MPLEQFHDKRPARLEDGIGLALSGGGYRAMVFHVGALIHLNEAALLPKIMQISSVSGGPITLGVLGPALPSGHRGAYLGVVPRSWHETLPCRRPRTF
jgi:hypothetical protein